MGNYVAGVVAKYKLPVTVDNATQTSVVNPLCLHIQKWASSNCYPLNEMKISGSRAKGTAISIASDLDLFISLSSSSDDALKTVYSSLYDYMCAREIECRKQNVSIGVVYGGKSVDLVPARRQSQWGNDHSLWKSKQNTWTKTNVVGPTP